MYTSQTLFNKLLIKYIKVHTATRWTIRHFVYPMYSLSQSLQGIE